MARDTHSARKPAGPGRKSRRPRTGKGLAQQTIAQAAAPVAQVVTRETGRGLEGKGEDIGRLLLAAVVMVQLLALGLVDQADDQIGRLAFGCRASRGLRCQ